MSSMSADAVAARQSTTSHVHIVFASTEGPSTSNTNTDRRSIQDEKERLKKLLSQNKKLQECLITCQGCGEPIFERYIWHCSGLEEGRWHGECLVCSVCQQRLTSKCFAKDDKLFCKHDFYRTFGNRCGGCQQGMAPDDMVRHSNEETYHLDCFACYVCGKQFSTGEEYYLMENKKLVCKADYDSAKSKEASNKRPRTTISAKQLETLKIAYTASSKPARHIREQLSQDTGLDMRVVQVWFQNRRAKEKRLKKDAGRHGWSQYFNGTMRKYDLDDDDDLMVEDDTMCSEKGDYRELLRNGYMDEDSSSGSYANHCKSPTYSSPDASAPGHNRFTLLNYSHAPSPSPQQQHVNTAPVLPHPTQPSPFLPQNALHHIPSPYPVVYRGTLTLT